MVVTAVALAALCAAPVAVVVDSKRPGGTAEAAELTSQLYLALIDAGLPRDQVLLEEEAEQRTLTGVFTRTRQCEGRTLCLRELAVILGPGAVVVGIDVGRVAGELAVHVLATRAMGEPLAELDLSVDSASWRSRLAPEVTRFARELGARLLVPIQPAASVVAAEAVAPAAPAPAPAPAATVVGTAWLAPLKWTVGGAAAASLVLGAVLLGTGMAAKSAYEGALVQVDGVQGTRLTAADAARLGTQANVELSFALGAALVGAALAAFATWLFVRG